MGRQKIVAGNWKMNLILPQARDLAREITFKLGFTENKHHIIVAPPFPFLTTLAEIFKDIPAISLGAQNCHWEDAGAFTGEVSAPMLRSIGVAYVILGHSERRKYFGETSALIAKKVDAVLRNDMSVIYCCGETLEERESGLHHQIVSQQLREGLFHLNAEDIGKVVIAYEPVWAIGTGKNATPVQAQEMHRFIRETVAGQYSGDIADGLTILYGGSCNPANAQSLFSQNDVDGGLIGGASLKADDFVELIKILNTVKPDG